jgi:hypothetical protein
MTGVGMPDRARRRTLSTGQLLRGLERLAPTLPAEQEDGQRFLVELLVFSGRLKGGGLAQQRLRNPHLALVLVRRGQQIEVVDVMPIHLRRNLFARVIGFLELVGAPERGNRLIEAADAPQVMPPHVMRMRDRRRGGREHFAVHQRIIDPVDGFIGVDQVVMRGGVPWCQPQGL